MSGVQNNDIKEQSVERDMSGVQNNDIKEQMQILNILQSLIGKSHA